MYAHIGWLVALASIGLIRSVTMDKHAWWRTILIVVTVGAVIVVGLKVLGVHEISEVRTAVPAAAPSLSSSASPSAAGARSKLPSPRQDPGGHGFGRAASSPSPPADQRPADGARGAADAGSPCTPRPPAGLEPDWSPLGRLAGAISDPGAPAEPHAPRCWPGLAEPATGAGLSGWRDAKHTALSSRVEPQDAHFAFAARSACFLVLPAGLFAARGGSGLMTRCKTARIADCRRNVHDLSPPCAVRQ